jgi:hypothetical protein
MDDTGKESFDHSVHMSTAYTGFFSVQVLEGALRVLGFTCVGLPLPGPHLFLTHHL